MAYALAGKIVSAPALGKSYPVRLPVVGETEIELPVEQLVHDAISAARDDLKGRLYANWPYLAGGAMLLVAGLIALRARNR